MSEWVKTHLPCPACGSSDAYSINDRGWGKCFSCGRNINENAEGSPVEETTEKRGKELVPFGEFRPLIKRKITEETCRKFGYFIGSYGGRLVQVAPYYSEDGKLIAQKVRGENKQFKTTGDFKSVTLFGQQLWRDGGNKLVITEGEIDCLSVSQLQGNKWPVVSVPNGAQGAAAAIKKHLEWVNSYKEVIILFDMDEPGQAAAIEVAELLPPGKAKIARLELKDANAMLVAGRGAEVIQAIWDAKTYRPDGLVSIDEILEEAEKPIEWGLPWWFEELTQATYGRRYGELYGFGAGTGVGKTDFLTQQIAFDVEQLKLPVGVIFLEQQPVETAKRIAGKMAGRRFHVPDAGWTVEEQRAALQSLKGKVTLYDSFGQTEWDVVSNKIRYMATALGIRIIYLDHLTAMADTANEKESIEQIMKEMAGLANELGIIIHFVSHLSTPEGKPHEEGGRVMIRHFKGSRAIGFWSYFMFGLERNQQADNEEEKQTTIFRILKDRYTGQATGLTFALGYERDAGRLYVKDYTPTSKPESHGFHSEGTTDF